MNLGLLKHKPDAITTRLHLLPVHGSNYLAMSPSLQSFLQSSEYLCFQPFVSPTFCRAREVAFLIIRHFSRFCYLLTGVVRSGTRLSWVSRVWCPTRHNIGHFGGGQGLGRKMPGLQLCLHLSLPCVLYATFIRVRAQPIDRDCFFVVFFLHFSVFIVLL